MIIGMTMIVEAAIISSVFAPPSDTNAYNPKGKVLNSLSTTANIGHKKLFHEAIAFKRIIVTNDGFAIGTITRH